MFLTPLPLSFDVGHGSAGPLTATTSLDVAAVGGVSGSLCSRALRMELLLTTVVHRAAF